MSKQPRVPCARPREAHSPHETLPAQLQTDVFREGVPPLPEEESDSDIELIDMGSPPRAAAALEIRDNSGSMPWGNAGDETEEDIPDKLKAPHAVASGEASGASRAAVAAEACEVIEIDDD